MVKSGRNHGEGKGGKTISKNTAKFLFGEDVFSCDMDDFVKKRKHFFQTWRWGRFFVFSNSSSSQTESVSGFAALLTTDKERRIYPLRWEILPACEKRIQKGKDLSLHVLAVFCFVISLSERGPVPDQCSGNRGRPRAFATWKTDMVFQNVIFQLIYHIHRERRKYFRF